MFQFFQQNAFEMIRENKNNSNNKNNNKSNNRKMNIYNIGI